MASFVGDYTCKLDHKGRVVIPSALRKELLTSGEEECVLRGNIYERCIDLYPKKAWLKMTGGLQERLNVLNRKQALFLREFFRGAMEVCPDGAGRILIPKKMLEMIGASEQLVMVGQGSKIEIWDCAAYEGTPLSPEAMEALSNELFGDMKI